MWSITRILNWLGLELRVRLGVSVSGERNTFVGLHKSPSGGCVRILTIHNTRPAVCISSLIVQSNLYGMCQWKLEVTTGLDFSGSAIQAYTSGDAGDEGDASKTPANGGNALEVGDAMQPLISSAPATPVVVNC